eukprot:124510-Prymnesium_polylepis.1
MAVCVSMGSPISPSPFAAHERGALTVGGRGSGLMGSIELFGDGCESSANHKPKNACMSHRGEAHTCCVRAALGFPSLLMFVLFAIASRARRPPRAESERCRPGIARDVAGSLAFCPVKRECRAWCGISIMRDYTERCEGLASQRLDITK